uniref:WAP domain-containing protein n=1 Tax=Crocodylus porosus TaxID=8502 RepID=A0A7M4EL49_CROPO
GTCPQVMVQPSSSPCQSRCEDDRTCPRNQKCCFTGCGLECIDPQKCCQSSCAAPDPRLPAAKPGECPKVRPWQTLVPCKGNDTCTHDRDCPKQEKCCFGGCFQHSCLYRVCPLPSHGRGVR